MCFCLLLVCASVCLSCASCRKDFNLACLAEYVKLHDFTNLTLVAALRQFLWNFRLPGEAQQIDRMMETFAQHYCHHEGGVVFANPDTCYVVSFGIIMLNTNLHNVNVKQKVSNALPIDCIPYKGNPHIDAAAVHITGGKQGVIL